MPAYKADRRWADRFIPQLKLAIADLLVAAAPDAEDMQRNTDLIALRVETLRVACRVRRFRYLTEYPFEFTIRSDRHNGTETELAKVLAGYGDYLVYAFAGEDEQTLVAGRILDLRQFRLWFHRQTVQQRAMPGMPMRNDDGSSTFHAFDVREMPAGVVVREWGFSPEPAAPHALNGQHSLRIA